MRFPTRRCEALKLERSEAFSEASLATPSLCAALCTHRRWVLSAAQLRADDKNAAALL